MCIRLKINNGIFREKICLQLAERICFWKDRKIYNNCLGASECDKLRFEAEQNDDVEIREESIQSSKIPQEARYHVGSIKESSPTYDPSSQDFTILSRNICQISFYLRSFSFTQFMSVTSNPDSEDRRLENSYCESIKLHEDL